jgi:hypothetical protein
VDVEETFECMGPDSCVQVASGNTADMFVLFILIMTQNEEKETQKRRTYSIVDLLRIIFQMCSR